VLLKLKHADSVFRAAQKIPDYVDFAGICRPQIEQIGFDGTARVYTSNPSVNQWPWEVRSAVVPHPGHKFVFFDWSAAELVLAAYWAKCSDLIERYERGEDLHRYISSCVLGKDDITDEEREVSKIVVFATIFGSEGDAPARALNISREEGEALVQRFLRIFPEIADLRDSVVGGCKETGYTMNYFGRIRQLPGILSDIPEEHEKARRQAFNTAIQGGTADCAKRAVIKLKKYAEEGVHYILSVFDSFLLEVPEDMPEYRIVDIVSDMCQMDDFRFRAKYGVGHTWLECKENEKPLISPQE
jgi:DNA polymerase-1